MQYGFLKLLEEQNGVKLPDVMIFHESILSSKKLQIQTKFIIGYIRRNCSMIIYMKDVLKQIIKYTKIPVSPATDSANFITINEINLSEKYRNEGNILFKQNKYQEAIIKYSSAHLRNLNDHRILCNRSLCHLKLNESDYAYKDVASLIRKAPTDFKCWCRYGAVAEKFNEINIAYLSYRTAKNILKYMNINKHEVVDKYNQIKKQMKRINYQWIKHFDNFKPKEALSLQLKHTMNQYKYRKYIKEDGFWQIYISQFMELYKAINCSKLAKYIIYKPQYIIFKSFPDDIERKTDCSWCVSYTTNGEIAYNKRLFIIDVCDQQFGFIQSMLTTYSKPKATQVIYCILRTIINPIMPTMTPYIPSAILIANRLKDESYEIMSILYDKFGIYCELESIESAKQSSKQNHTDVNGYNYCWNKEKKIEHKNQCQNWKCNIGKTKKIKWKICSRCKKVRYCSKQCQKYDWKHRHNRDCYDLKTDKFTSFMYKDH